LKTDQWLKTKTDKERERERERERSTTYQQNHGSGCEDLKAEAARESSTWSLDSWEKVRKWEYERGWIWEKVRENEAERARDERKTLDLECASEKGTKDRHCIS